MILHYQNIKPRGIYKTTVARAMVAACTTLWIRVLKNSREGEKNIMCV